jgi:hypothetical protein
MKVTSYDRLILQTDLETVISFHRNDDFELQLLQLQRSPSLPVGDVAF